MTDDEFRAVRATMPWTEHLVVRGKQTVIQLVDNTGTEVPLLTMVRFIVTITAKLAKERK